MFIRFQCVVFFLCLGFCGFVQGQDDAKPPTAPTENASPQPKPDSNSTVEQLKTTEEKLAKQAQDEMSKIAKVVDQDPRAKQTAAGILQPIYTVAENLSFPAFHWVAFALMCAGVLSYALQLVLGKLVVLMRRGFSMTEIVSDAVGLAISVFGLVLTTQAAAENSTFTRSPAAVISATLVGIVAGIILYRWGQAQEIEAAAGRSRMAAKK